MNENKKKVPKWLVFIALFLLIAIICGITFGNDETESNNKNTTSSDERTTKDPDYTLANGKLISAIKNTIDSKEVIVIKAKIESSWTDSMTIDQNYYNVADLIKKQGCDKFDEIQYWAVADMASGEEAKVISFTLSSDTIKQIKNEKIVDNQIGEHADDLWILPSLKN